MKQLIESVQSAYALISEGKQVESKFKVGDKVGIGAFNGLYYPHDTGTVSAIDKHGVHTVVHDTHKENDSVGNIKPAEQKFDAAGHHVARINRQIVSLADHNSNIDTTNKTVERTNDLNRAAKQLSGFQNSFGHFGPLDKGSVDHIKSLLDKHCE